MERWRSRLGSYFELNREVDPHILEVQDNVFKKIPDLANIVFGVALTFTAALSDFSSDPRENALTALAWWLVSKVPLIILFIAAWITYIELTQIVVLKSSLRSGRFLVCMTMPLLCVLVAAGAAAPGLGLALGNISDNTALLRGALQVLSACALSSFFLSMYIVGKILVQDLSMPNSVCHDMVLRSTFSREMSVICLLGTAVMASQLLGESDVGIGFTVTSLPFFAIFLFRLFTFQRRAQKRFRSLII